VKENVLLALNMGRHVVIGTSGLSAADYRQIDAAARAAHRGAIAAGNFSITATLLKRFALEAAQYVPDVEVPSGTARELAEEPALVNRQPTAKPISELFGARETRGAAIGESAPVQVHSLRLPSYVISCEAIFGAADERLTIRHDAGASATPYVAGTLLAVRRVIEIQGLGRGLDAVLTARR
jgi:4-hydroxy-tetrahydrodipicolinate reductase